MDQYCPVCFNKTLVVAQSGLVNVIVNGMQMDAGRILFNAGQFGKTIKEDLAKKLAEFFEWYSKFQNKQAIKELHLVSTSFKCLNGCKIGNQNMSVIDHLITRKEILQILSEASEKFGIKIDLKEENIN